MKITVGIITRNRKELLNKCLRSIIDNSIKPYEIIIIDNASTDRTKEIINHNKKIFKNIRYYKERKIGRSQARKRLFFEFNGEILALTDDDCIVDKNWIKNIDSSFKKNPNISVIQGNAISIHSSTIIQKDIQIKHDVYFNRNTIKNRIYILDTKNCSLRKKIVKFLKIDENLIHEDIDMAMQLQEKDIKIQLDKNVIVYHQEKNTWGLIEQGLRAGKFYQQIKTKWDFNEKISSKHPKYSIYFKILYRLPFRLGFYYQLLKNTYFTKTQ